MRIAVSIVLFDSADDIVAGLEALADQARQPDTVVVFDNASSDDGAERAARVMPTAQLVRSPVNIGFAAGHNRAIALAPADVHVVLNPDCRLAPGFLEAAVRALESDPTAGSVTGRLLRFRHDSPDSGPLEERPDDILDSTGMVGQRNRRVLDRAAEQAANGRDLQPAYVFGASGAAAVYRRAMLEDVAVGGEMFDEAFFAFREDVDLAWRAQLLGWRCRYVPAALARHRRRVAPGRRSILPARINRISVANRWRMIAKNETMIGWASDWWAIGARDLGVLAYALFREPRTIGAVLDMVRDASRLRAWRRDIMRRRRTPDREVLAWFGRQEERPLQDSPPA
ncbi:MAG: glycosyltransferase family 2 protein [Chloroflexota bacterium]